MKIVTALFVASAAVLPAFAADTPNMDVVVSGKTAPTIEIAFWTENGKQMLARGEAVGPVGAVQAQLGVADRIQRLRLLIEHYLAG